MNLTDVKATVTKINDFYQSQTSDFQKQTIFVKTSGDYPQNLELSFINKKTALSDMIEVGDEITFSANLRGREWTAKDGEVKVFMSLEVWKCDGKTS